ncbi:MAG: ribonuclease P protein component [Bacilli bacterium]|jgi:ribonuclease P protein component|nr:ribonuclease P protein component [Bacilli bacterium]
MKKENRIKKNEEIAKIVLSKQKVKSDYFFIYYQKGETLTRVAVSVSKKIGNSVERNHAKRIIRELVRPNLKIIMPLNLVIVVKKNLNDVEFIKLKDEMFHCLKLIERRLTK